MINKAMIPPIQASFMQDDFYYLVFGGIIILAIAAAIGYAYYRILKKALTVDFLGKELWTRVLNISLTIIIFRSVFNLLILWPIKILLDLTGIAVSRDYIILTSKNGDGSSPGVFNQIYNTINLEAGNSLSVIDVNIINLLFAILFLVLLAVFEMQIFYNNEAKTYSLKHLSSTLKKSISLSIIMLAGLYLLLVAIIATTKISTSSFDPHISVTKLDSTLNKMANQDDIKKSFASIDTGLNTVQVTLQLKSLDETFQKSPNKQFYNQDYNRFKDSVNQNLSDITDDFKEQINNHNAMMNNYVRSTNLLENKINSKYANISHNLTNPQREKYMDQLSDYFAGQVNFKSNAIINSADNLKATKIGEQIKIGMIVKNIDAFQDYLNSATDKKFDWQSIKWGRLDEYAIGDSGTGNTPDKLPEPEKSSQEWGIVGAMSSWLTDTLSLNLTIIIGMIGFGIFGAGISSFITKETETQKGVSSLESVITVMVKGFSAALIIYLFAKSGLSLANNGNTDPNPYFLYFSCLTGAVFSDRIWDWAKSFIDKNYKPIIANNTNILTTDTDPTKQNGGKIEDVKQNLKASEDKTGTVEVKKYASENQSEADTDEVKQN